MATAGANSRRRGKVPRGLETMSPVFKAPEQFSGHGRWQGRPRRYIPSEWVGSGAPTRANAETSLLVH